eukprot:TRINITY_DN8252_c0_g1_i1.p1 TRINITY_DN8252_c0_g1~~TRINITY_DN8252_c0_g1_i1.p1  ORF type:complete len:110 (+),score=26.70 TRINITY_DN8252_c0_g1_i1:247-576(+)
MAKSTSEGTTKGMVTEQISQAVLSTTNLLQLMQESSPAQGLSKLPKSFLTKIENVKHTEQSLEQLPQVISSLDAYLDRALQCASELHTVSCLLKNEQTQSTSQSTSIHE